MKYDDHKKHLYLASEYSKCVPILSATSACFTNDGKAVFKKARYSNISVLPWCCIGSLPVELW